MAAQNIKVDVSGAQGTYSAAAADLAANRGVVGPDGVRAGFGATLAGLSTTSNTNLDSAAALNGQGGQFANGFDAADKDGAAKAGAAGPKGPGDPSNPAGAPKVPGADQFASRLTPQDLLKVTNASTGDDSWFHDDVWMPPVHDPSKDVAGPGPDSVGRGLAPVHPISNAVGPAPLSQGAPHVQMVSSDDSWFHDDVWMPPVHDPSKDVAGPGPDSVGRGLAPVHPI